MSQRSKLIYKIVSRELWKAAEDSGVFEGAAIDLQDGYIHFSAADQVRETAAKHFRQQDDLVLVAVDVSQFGEELKWERSRGGELFPHLYGSLDPGSVQAVFPLPLGDDGVHRFPQLPDREQPSV